MKLPLRRPAVVLAATMAAFVVALPSTALAGPHAKAKEYSLAEYSVPADITTGPDGALWAPDGSLGRLWRVSTKGKVSSIQIGGVPAGVATGRDGALWVTDRDDKIHRVTTGGKITTYPLHPPESDEDFFPTSIVAGPDGALWFTESHGDSIGRITTTGDVTRWKLKNQDAFAANITVGPDGALWFTESSANTVGRITTSGELEEYLLDTPDSNPGPIVARDGALYFEANNDVVSRMNTAGKVTRRYQLPTGALPLGLASTRHGLYVAEHTARAIVALNPWGAWSGRAMRTKSEPDALTVGPDGALWYASGNEAKIGRLEIDR